MKLIKKLICLSLPLLLCAGPARGQDLPDSFAMYGEGKEPTINYVKAVDSVLIDTARPSTVTSPHTSTPTGSDRWRHC